MAADKVIATNRKAYHDYEILETHEAGIVLRGTEVKSLRESQVNFRDCYAAVDNGEAWLIGCYIAPYHHGTDANHDPERGARQEAPRQAREHSRARGEARDGERSTGTTACLKGGRPVSTGINEAQVASRGACSS